MNLVRFHNPYSDVNQSLVNQVFDSFLKNDYDESYLNDCQCMPATNVFETDNEFKLEVLLPGFKKEDVQLNFHENVLTVKVDLPENKEEE